MFGRSLSISSIQKLPKHHLFVVVNRPTRPVNHCSIQTTHQMRHTFVYSEMRNNLCILKTITCLYKKKECKSCYLIISFKLCICGGAWLSIVWFKAKSKFFHPKFLCSSLLRSLPSLTRCHCPPAAHLDLIYSCVLQLVAFVVFRFTALVSAILL